MWAFSEGTALKKFGHVLMKAVRKSSGPSFWDSIPDFVWFRKKEQGPLHLCPLILFVSIIFMMCFLGGLDTSPQIFCFVSLALLASTALLSFLFQAFSSCDKPFFTLSETLFSLTVNFSKFLALKKRGPQILSTPNSHRNFNNEASSQSTMNARYSEGFIFEYGLENS
jgi:hypothetical protein